MLQLMSRQPTGLSVWAAQQDLAISGSSLGPGVGGFFGTGDMGFINDAAW
jgi:hypothetical protein